MALTKGDKLISGGVKSRAIDVDYDNTSSGLEAATVQEAIDKVAAKPGITYTLTQDSTDKKKLTFAPSEGAATVITTQDTWIANTKDKAGYVSAPGAVANKVWKTDANGNPGWREDTGGGTGDIMTGATWSADGAAGAAPAPRAGQHFYVLKGNGTWDANAGGSFYKSYWANTTDAPDKGGTSSMGYQTKVSANASHAEGYYTTASGICACHTEGYQTYTDWTNNEYKLGGLGLHAEGYKTTATTTIGNYYGNHAEGCNTVARGASGAHSEGYYTTANANYQGAHAEGNNTYASGSFGAHAEGNNTYATGHRAHAEGYNTTAVGNCSHAEGVYCCASGACSSHAGGYYTTAINTGSYSIGHYNAAMIPGAGGSNTTGTAFVIGKGTGASALSNAFSVQYNGVVKAASSITASTTADYAELFEWQDGNPDAEDRVGHFVTINGEKIRIANDTDDYILGITSGRPFVLGNGDCDVWTQMFLYDDFNRYLEEPAPKMEYEPIYEDKEIKTVDEEGNEITITVQECVGIKERESETEFEGTRHVLNPEYNPDKPYISRLERPEWAAVGMLGVLSVYQDGTAEVDKYVTVNKDGIATACDKNVENAYRVVKVISDEIIKVIIK